MNATVPTGQRYQPLDMLARLVAFDTVSHKSNLDLIAFVEGYLTGWGVPSVRFPNATGDKAALFATIGPQDKGGIVLSGHTDVVPVTDQDWSSDPFLMRQSDGRLYGRGACDMKGFIAAATVMAAAPSRVMLVPPVRLFATALMLLPEVVIAALSEKSNQPGPVHVA